MSNYAKKADLINVSGTDAPSFTKKDLANLKSNLDKLDIDKIKKCSN